MKLGLALDLGSAALVADQVGDALPVLRTAEDVGVDAVWIGESYHRRPEPFHLPSALLVLAHLAARTSLRLGTGVLLLRAYDPLRLAYETALLDQLSGGRLTVGIGLGPADLRTRFGTSTRPDAALETLRKAWNEVAPAPVSGPRLLVGGGAEVAVRRAATYGDGYYAATNYTDRLLARQASAYRELVPGGKVVANRLCLVHPDGSRARELAEQYFAPVAGYYSSRGLWESVPGDPAAPSTLVGTPAEVGAALRGYAEAGVTTVNLRVKPFGTPPDVARRTLELVTAAIG
ncbi:LLM class flavin-dependent oxidoreductase [Cryptosporangium arvum]|uniref:LLM class flavin-dependent oxidoreductase n=1 Tax=Cryptosporangium arvum TaxID=80871 RepID=UPI0004AEDCEE|nr:LLM class flavin-dependent oxidoreductase [Cryptosporangium arvum]